MESDYLDNCINKTGVGTFLKKCKFCLNEYSIDFLHSYCINTKINNLGNYKQLQQTDFVYISTPNILYSPPLEKKYLFFFLFLFFFSSVSNQVVYENEVPKQYDICTIFFDYISCENIFIKQVFAIRNLITMIKSYYFIGKVDEIFTNLLPIIDRLSLNIKNNLKNMIYTDCSSVSISNLGINETFIKVPPTLSKSQMNIRLLIALSEELLVIGLFLQYYIFPNLTNNNKIDYCSIFYKYIIQPLLNMLIDNDDDNNNDNSDFSLNALYSLRLILVNNTHIISSNFNCNSVYIENTLITLLNYLHGPTNGKGTKSSILYNGVYYLCYLSGTNVLDYDITNSFILPEIMSASSEVGIILSGTVPFLTETIPHNNLSNTYMSGNNMSNGSVSIRIMLCIIIPLVIENLSYLNINNKILPILINLLSTGTSPNSKFQDSDRSLCIRKFALRSLISISGKWPTSPIYHNIISSYTNRIVTIANSATLGEIPEDEHVLFLFTLFANFIAIKVFNDSKNIKDNPESKEKSDSTSYLTMLTSFQNIINRLLTLLPITPNGNSVNFVYYVLCTLTNQLPILYFSMTNNGNSDDINYYTLFMTELFNSLYTRITTTAYKEFFVSKKLNLTFFNYLSLFTSSYIKFLSLIPEDIIINKNSTEVSKTESFDSLDTTIIYKLLNLNNDNIAMLISRNLSIIIQSKFYRPNDVLGMAHTLALTSKYIIRLAIANGMYGIIELFLFHPQLKSEIEQSIPLLLKLWYILLFDNVLISDVIIDNLIALLKLIQKFSKNSEKIYNSFLNEIIKLSYKDITRTTTRRDRIGSGKFYENWKSYKVHLIFIKICKVLIFSESTPSHMTSKLWAHLLKLAYDPVINVRISLSNLLSKVIKWCSVPDNGRDNDNSYSIPEDHTPVKLAKLCNSTILNDACSILCQDSCNREYFINSGRYGTILPIEKDEFYERLFKTSVIENIENMSENFIDNITMDLFSTGDTVPFVINEVVNSPSVIVTASSPPPDTESTLLSNSSNSLSLLPVNFSNRAIRIKSPLPNPLQPPLPYIKEF